MVISTRKILSCLVIAVSLMSSDVRYALSGFASGFMHPMMGLDHLLTMLAVGIWATQNKRTAVWVLPLAFPLMMMLGALLAVKGVNLTGAEAGIALSVSILGLLIACAVSLPALGSCVVIGLFALAHGYAHGRELPTNESGLLFGAGFVVATVLLQLLVVSMSRALIGRIASKAMRFLGAGIAITGLFLLSALA
jgi:urease accessory protein